MLSEQDITNSQGETKKTTYKYATNFEDKNILNLPTNMLTYFDDGLDEQSNKFKYRLLSGAKVDYDDLGRPEKTYTATLNGSETSLCSSNNPCSYKEEAVYYYNNEVLTQITSSEGSSTVFLWNSLRQLIIAKIENATYNQVQSYDGADLSDSKTLYNEIKTSLSDDVLITTYSYNGSSRNPSEITDPRGYTTYYEYDEAQRLKYIKDEEGNILSKNEYNYKN
jgi:YD repeat-containing protein